MGTNLRMLATRGRTGAATVLVLAVAGCFGPSLPAHDGTNDPMTPAPFVDPPCVPSVTTDAPSGVSRIDGCGLLLRLSDASDTIVVEDTTQAVLWQDLHVASTSGAVAAMRLESLVVAAEEGAWANEPLALAEVRPGTVGVGQSVVLCSPIETSRSQTLRLGPDPKAPLISLDNLRKCPGLGVKVDLPLTETDLPCTAFTSLHRAVQGFDHAAKHLVIVDASRDGGTWWHPQLPGRENPSQDHQGADLVARWRTDEVLTAEFPREQRLTGSMLSCADAVVRAADFPMDGGAASAPVVQAYVDYVRNGGRLLLIQDHMKFVPNDAVASGFGIEFQGSTSDRAVVQVVEDHPITHGIMDLRFLAGTCAVKVPEGTKVLARYASSVRCDLDNDGQADPDEPTGAPAIGVVPFGKGEVVFLAELNFLELVPQPFTDQLTDYVLRPRS